MNVPLIEIILGYDIRLEPQANVGQSQALSWTSVSVDNHYWPTAVSPVGTSACHGPFPELFDDFTTAKQHFRPEQKHVLLAISLPTYVGCEHEHGYKHFVELTNGFGDTAAIQKAWLSSRPVISEGDIKWTRLGYDIVYVGAFRSMMFSIDARGDWKFNVSGRHSKYGLFESFSDAHLHSVKLTKEGLVSGWPLVETHLWPVGVWLYSGS